MVVTEYMASCLRGADGREVRFMKVNTVLGPIDPGDMGVTLMHEHIANIEWNLARAIPGFYDRDRVVEMFCGEMETLRPYGVKTFVDATPINLGRDVELMRRCSEHSGVQIIACTGLYWQERPFFHMGLEAERLADMMIREIEQGMEGTDSKPGFIKCATQLQPGETETNRNMLRAAALACKATGLPIYTHTQPGSQLAAYQQRVFAEEGVAPEKIAFGHVFAGMQRDYIRGLAEGGSYVGCDQLGFEAGCMEQMADLLADLFQRGHRRQIFLSCDAALWSDFGCTFAKDHRDRDSNPMIGHDLRRKTLFEMLLPMLRQRGVAESVIEDVLVGNPRRFFGGE